MPRTNPVRPLRRLTPALVLLALLAACDRSPRAATPAADEHAGHDHDEHADEATLTAEAIERYGVKVQPAQLWALTPTFSAPARVAFNTEAMAHVGSPLRGRAVEIPVHLGDAVKRGDPLLVLESPELGEAQNDFFQKRIAAQAAAPAVELAKVAWERAKGLYEQSQGLALGEVQKREAEFKTAAAALKASEAAAVGAENRLHLLGMTQAAVETLAKSGEIAPRLTLHAPIDGQVVQREITLGELVSPDREALMVLADPSASWILADVPDSRLPEVAVGAKAWVAAGPLGAPRLEGRVVFIAPHIDAATRTAQVRIEAPAGALALKPGMFAQAEIVAANSAESAPAIAVPEQAVQTVEGGPAVFVPVKGEPNTFAKRAVSVGPAVGGLVPILSGLVEGEEFVAAGAFILKAELGKGAAAHEH